MDRLKDRLAVKNKTKHINADEIPNKLVMYPVNFGMNTYHTVLGNAIQCTNNVTKAKNTSSVTQAVSSELAAYFTGP